MKGFWSVDWGADDKLVSLYEGVQNKLGKKADILYAKGCNINDSLITGFQEAINAAKNADVVVMAVGETFDMSGEAKSRANIGLPGVQEQLIKAIQETGKPVVVLIMAGRPLVFNYTAQNVKSIAYTWWLGSEAGNAIADVLFGDYNPSGKLTMSFPRSVGQIPVYYNYYNTGRPAVGNNTHYRSAYLDLPNSPQYAFGHGLSYTSFKYDQLSLDKTSLSKDEKIKVSFKLTNTGKYDGEEVVQLYLKDEVAQPIRPVKELKDFKKVALKAGETKEISFLIDQSKLSFYNDNLEVITQPGDFKLMVGSASDDIRLEGTFSLK
jgi:beta-glucosidase